MMSTPGSWQSLPILVFKKLSKLCIVILCLSFYCLWRTIRDQEVTKRANLSSYLVRITLYIINRTLLLSFFKPLKQQLCHYLKPLCEHSSSFTITNDTELVTRRRHYDIWQYLTKHASTISSSPHFLSLKRLDLGSIQL